MPIGVRIFFFISTKIDEIITRIILVENKFIFFKRLGYSWLSAIVLVVIEINEPRLMNRVCLIDDIRLQSKLLQCDNLSIDFMQIFDSE